jgi:hypothetical protein
MEILLSIFIISGLVVLFSNRHPDQRLGACIHSSNMCQKCEREGL